MIVALTIAVLSYDLTPGTKRTYETERVFSAIDENENTTFVDRLSFFVTTEKIDGLSKVKVTFEPIKTILDGNTIPASSGAKPLELSELRDKQGVATQRTLMPMEKVLRERQSRILDVVYPEDDVQVGSSWSRHVDMIDGMFPEATWVWTCTAMTRGVATLQLEFSETEASDAIKAEGTIDVDVRTGWPVKGSVSVAKTVLPGDEERIPMTLKTTWKLVR